MTPALGRVPVRAATEAGPRPGTINPIEREVLDLQRSAGNRAVTAAVQRQTALVVQREPAADAGYKIISQTWEVAGRPIVIVATGRGDEVLFFYLRSGKGEKGIGAKVAEGKWAPFKTLMAQDAEIIGKEIEVHGMGERIRFADPNYRDPKTNKLKRANPKEAWFNKQPHYSKPETPELRGYGNETNKSVGEWLDKQKVDPPTGTKDWQKVEAEMDNVANRYRAAERMKGKPTHVGARHGPIAGAESPHGPDGGGSGGGGSAGKAEAQAGAAEVKGAGLEAKAAGAEGKAIGTEAKLIGPEVTGAMKTENILTKGAQIAGGAAKAARVSELIIALGMPGPQDVLFMFIAAFASIAEAKAKLRADAYATGFAQGLAAVITWTSADDAQRMLMYKVVDPSIGERSSGFAGIREKGTNEGIASGWKFGNALNGTQRKGFRHEALEATGLKEKRHSSRDDLIEMGAALRPDVLVLLEEAARQEEEKRRLERIADMANHPVYH